MTGSFSHWAMGNFLSTFTPLMWAVIYDKPEIVTILLDFNADVNIKSIENKTAVDYADELPKDSKIKKSAVFKRLQRLKLTQQDKKGQISMTKIDSQFIIDTMITTAAISIERGDYAQAVEIYKKILQLQPNETAQYNLGTLYAQGKGIKQDFKEAAYWFNQAHIMGDEQAGKLCIKCMTDFIHQGFEHKTSEKIYFDMVGFVKFIWPCDNIEHEINEKLYAMAGNHFNKQEYAEAAKLFRAAAEFGNDGNSQNALAVLYNMGAGIEKNDLASLYWFDKAVDNGIKEARIDRDGILNAYGTNFSSAEFYKQMMILSGWCSIGSEDVPKDTEKAAYWSKIAENKR